MNEEFMKHLPHCARCRELIPAFTPPAKLVEVRFRYEGTAHYEQFVGSPLTYHAECAPIVRGKLLRPGHVHVLPAPAVRNRRSTDRAGLIVWYMERLTKSGERLAYRVAIDPVDWPFGSRKDDVYRLRRARGLLRRAGAEQGGNKP
jgi:hypothetical protein